MEAGLMANFLDAAREIGWRGGLAFLGIVTVTSIGAGVAVAAAAGHFFHKRDKKALTDLRQNLLRAAQRPLASRDVLKL